MTSPTRGALGALLLVTTFTALAATAQTGKAGEWPQWRGPERNGISRETGLLKSWPEGGPRLVWKAEGLGGGYSTPSVAGGRLYGMSYRGADEIVWARDVATGAEIWSTRIAAATPVSYGEGSRSTPTFDGGRLYSVGVGGDVVCLDAATGKLLWQKSLVRDFGGKVPNWGYAESPLIDGDRVIVTPGGRTATLVALNKTSGEVAWTCAVPRGDAAAYSSAIKADVDGQRHVIQFLTGGLVGVRAEDGKFLWRTDRPANGIVIATPVYRDRHVFASTAYQKGGGCYKLTTTPDGVEATEVYFDPEMQNHHGGILLLGDYMYYAEGHQRAALVCREFKTGKLMWRDPNQRKSSLVYADGLLYSRSERGTVSLVEPTPKEYVEKSSFEQPFRSGKNAWPHPVVAGGRLYLRDQDVLLCYDVKQP